MIGLESPLEIPVTGLVEGSGMRGQPCSIDHVATGM